MSVLRTSPKLITLSLCLALLMWLTPTIHADPIFSFSDSPSPTPITGANGNSITLTGLSGSGQDAGNAGGVNEQILDINLNNSGSATDTFSTTINFPLTITDTLSSTSNIVNFSGLLSGTLDPIGGSSIQLSGVTPLTPTTFDLGGFTFVVTLQSTNAFLTPGDNFITVNVQGAPVNSQVPEPNSLALWGVVGIFGLGFGYRNLRGKVAV